MSTVRVPDQVVSELTDWIAETPEQYVEIASRKARDIAALAELRGQLRNRVTTSIIGDADAYVRAVEIEYRQLWREWCERQTGSEPSPQEI